MKKQLLIAALVASAAQLHAEAGTFTYRIQDTYSDKAPVVYDNQLQKNIATLNKQECYDLVIDRDGGLTVSTASTKDFWCGHKLGVAWIAHIVNNGLGDVYFNYVDRSHDADVNVNQTIPGGTTLKIDQPVPWQTNGQATVTVRKVDDTFLK